MTRKIDRSISCGCQVDDLRKGTIGANGECARGPLQPTFPLTYHPSQFCRFLHPHVISHFSASLNSSKRSRNLCQLHLFIFIIYFLFEMHAYEVRFDKIVLQFASKVCHKCFWLGLYQSDNY